MSDELIAFIDTEPSPGIPKKLSRKEKEALEHMRGSESFEPDLSRDDKALFDKMRNNF